MKKEILKEYINTRIMEKLEKIGFDQFCYDISEGKTSYEVDFIFDCGKKYLFSVEFTIESNGMIKKDSEYYGIDVATHKEEEFKVRPCSDQSPTLQELFDIWESKNWNKRRESMRESRAFEETKINLNERER